VEPVAARTAFFEAYKPARTWAPDLLALSVVSGEVPGFKNEDGKAGLWAITFVSPARKEARTFTYAIADSGQDIHKGVTIGNVLVWGGATRDSKPFSSSEFAVDSDAAYKTAAAKGAAWIKSHPGMKATLRLGNASRFSAPIWYIQWGTSKNGYVALVNATTGELNK
jgi:hypothetical protein